MSVCGRCGGAAAVQRRWGLDWGGMASVMRRRWCDCGFTAARIEYYRLGVMRWMRGCGVWVVSYAVEKHRNATKPRYLSP
jgi:hypothetical protein